MSTAKDFTSGKRQTPEVSVENDENRDIVQEKQSLTSPLKNQVVQGAIKSLVNIGRTTASALSPLKKHRIEDESVAPKFITSSPMRNQNRMSKSYLLY
jgi:hypothetical protein